MIINATVHKATQDQIAAGVVDLPPEAQEKLKGMLIFDEIPTSSELTKRALGVETLIAEAFSESSYNAIMIGGAPFFQSHLENAIANSAILKSTEYCYAFSKRECVETESEYGNVKKSYIFKHMGFYKP